MPWPKKNSGNYLRLKNGDTVTIQLLAAEPDITYQHWHGNEPEDCTAPDCADCTDGIKRSAKCKINVLDLADKKEKSLEGSSAMFNAIKTVIDMTDGGKGSSYMIKATGEKSERRYTVLPLNTVPHAIGAKTEEKDEQVPF